MALTPQVHAPLRWGSSHQERGLHGPAMSYHELGAQLGPAAGGHRALPRAPATPATPVSQPYLSQPSHLSQPPHLCHSHACHNHRTCVIATLLKACVTAVPVSHHTCVTAQSPHLYLSHTWHSYHTCVTATAVIATIPVSQPHIHCSCHRHTYHSHTCVTATTPVSQPQLSQLPHVSQSPPTPVSKPLPSPNTHCPSLGSSHITPCTGSDPLHMLFLVLETLFPPTLYLPDASSSLCLCSAVPLRSILS